MVLEDAPQKLTRQDILDEWPPDFATPSANALWRWLDRGVQAGQILCEGSGRKADPFRYWLAATEARWKEHFLYDILEEQRRTLKLPFVSLREKKQQDHRDGRDDDDDSIPRAAPGQAASDAPGAELRGD
jgi:hypothetical protein